VETLAAQVKKQEKMLEKAAEATDGKGKKNQKIESGNQYCGTSWRCKESNIWPEPELELVYEVSALGQTKAVY
jgi:hypothetical protein